MDSFIICIVFLKKFIYFFYWFKYLIVSGIFIMFKVLFMNVKFLGLIMRYEVGKFVSICNIL